METLVVIGVFVFIFGGLILLDLIARDAHLERMKKLYEQKL